MADNVIYLTKQGLEKLEAELKHLKEVRRVEIAAKLKEAISFGDLSENAEYEDARNEQAQVEVRITEIEEQLKNVVIIKKDLGQKSGKITMGMEVEIEDLETGEKESYKIVGTQESDILANPPRISNDSPVGKAILGKTIGEEFEVKTPQKVFKYVIINIK